MTTPNAQANAPGPHPKARLFTLFLIVFIDLMGFGMVLPNVQLYGELFGIYSPLALAMFGTAYSAFQFLFAPILGRWSDRIGRRPVLIVSQIGTLAGFLMLYVAHFFTGELVAVGITLLYLSRVIDGISGGNISTANAYIADITTPENRAKGMGLLGAALGLGFVFGPAIGGITATSLGLEYVGLVAAGFSATALVLTITKLPESLVPGRPAVDARRFSILGLRKVIRRPAILALVVMGFVNGFAFAGMEQTFSLLIRHRFFPYDEAAAQAVKQSLNEKAAAGAAGVFFGIGVVIVLIQGGLIGKLTRRFGETALLATGPAFVTVGLVMVGMPWHWGSRWIGLVLGSLMMAIGSALFSPSINSLISRHAGTNEQGEMLGVNQGMGSLARALGPVLAGYLFGISVGLPYYVAAVMTAAVTLVAIALRPRLHPPAGAPSAVH